MDDFEVEFDFEDELNADVGGQPTEAPQSMPANARKNYRQTVCRHWLRGLCMKGNNCGFLHQFDKQRMPTCRFYAKYNECKEPDCPFKHSLEDVKDCNMFKLGFCIHGPNCRCPGQPRKTIPPRAFGSLLRGAPSHMQRYQMALAKQQSEAGREGGGPGGGGGGAPPPLPPGPPPSGVKMGEQLMALPDAPGAGGGVDEGGGVGGGSREGSTPLPPPSILGGGVVGTGGGGGDTGGASYHAPPLAGEGLPGMPGAAAVEEEDHGVPSG